MRIDPLQVAAMVNQADSASVRRAPPPQKAAQENPRFETPKPEPAVPSQMQLSVSIDNDKNIIYQFLDMRTGEVVQQITPEQVLKIMRSVADQLRHYRQNFETTV